MANPARRGGDFVTPATDPEAELDRDHDHLADLLGLDPIPGEAR